MVTAELFAIVQRRLGFQWRQCFSRQWHKVLELHCTGTEGAPIHLSVINNGWRGEVRMIHFVNSHSGLLSHQSLRRAPPVLYLFQASDEIWPSEEAVILYFLRAKWKMSSHFFIVSFKPDIFLILTLRGSVKSSSTELLCQYFVFIACIFTLWFSPINPKKAPINTPYSTCTVLNGSQTKLVISWWMKSNIQHLKTRTNRRVNQWNLLICCWLWMCLLVFMFFGGQKWIIVALRNNVVFWERLCLFAALPRVRWEDQYQESTCLG